MIGNVTKCNLFMESALSIILVFPLGLKHKTLPLFLSHSSKKNPKQYLDVINDFNIIAMIGYSLWIRCMRVLWLIFH